MQMETTVVHLVGCVSRLSILLAWKPLAVKMVWHGKMGIVVAFAVFLKISKTHVQDVHRKTPPSSGFQLCSDGTTRSSW